MWHRRPFSSIVTPLTIVLRINHRSDGRLRIPTKRNFMSMTATNRKTALMLCSVVPDLSGYGLAMRAGNFLEALLEEHTVTLVVIATSTSVHSKNAIAYWNSKSARMVLSGPVPLLKKQITNFSLLSGIFNP